MNNEQVEFALGASLNLIIDPLRVYEMPGSWKIPLMNIINGGAHANNGLRIQEFMIRPDKAKSFSEGVRICFIVINKLRDLIKKMGHSTSVGDEGGFAPMINDNESELKLIVKSINLSGFKNGKDIVICLDVAANELIKNKHYSIHSKKYVNVDKTIFEYIKLIRNDKKTN